MPSLPYEVYQWVTPELSDRVSIDTQTTLENLEQMRRTMDSSRAQTASLHYQGSPSLLAEVERCYNILRLFPSPQDRTEQDIENLMIALTEEVATITENRNLQSTRTRTSLRDEVPF